MPFHSSYQYTTSAYVPFQQIGIEFLNRKDRISLQRNGKDPKSFMQDAYAKVDAVFARKPAGTTPALEKLQESFLRGQGVNIARYFFGDGLPNGGQQAINEIVKLLKNRQNPEGNPMTFISCTNEDEAVEVRWLWFALDWICWGVNLVWFDEASYL